MANGYSIGGNQGIDISSDGNKIFIAALDEGYFPVLLTLNSNLEEYAEAVYEPAAGTEINVICGDLIAYWTWAFGDFGGDLKVIFSESQDPYWYIADPGGWSGPASPGFIGPSDDGQFLIVRNDDFYFSEAQVGDEGAIAWIDLDSFTYFDVRALHRSKYSEQDIFFGGTAFVDTLGIQRTINYGYTLANMTYNLEDTEITGICCGDALKEFSFPEDAVIPE